MFLKLLITLGLCLTFFVTPTMANPQGIPILCYHDVGKPTNPYTVSPANLKAHFEYLKNNGYTPISLDQYIAACQGTGSLPTKPVLLTFDDGYVSFYTEILPLLKSYNYPAVFAIVTSWPDYAPPDVGKILTWQQLREIEASGLVSLASHSHKSHRGTVQNSFGDTGYMLETRQYYNGQYEPPELYRNRLRADFHQSQEAFEEHLGHKVKALVWPYGGYNQECIDIGKSEGFEVFLGLDGGFNPPQPSSLEHGRRGIIMDNPNVSSFAKYLNAGGYTTTPINASQLDIDLIYDADPKQTEQNLDLAIERFNAAQVNTIYLSTFSDNDGSGNINSVYFYTTHAPVKADIFSHIAARLHDQGFKVYAWLPTLACQWLVKDNPTDKVIPYASKGEGWYKRATPFSKHTQDELAALCTDLSAYSYIDGVLFQDDLYLNDYEDFSPPGKQAFYNATGYELTPANLTNPELRQKWTDIKSTALTNLTKQLIAAMKLNRPYLATARNIYPSIITLPESSEWFAQDYQQFLQNYDYTIIMAYPYLEKEYNRPLDWLNGLATNALTNKTNAQRVVFKLQTYDWNKKRWLSNTELKLQLTTLKKQGAINFAYYPENVFSEQ